MNEIWLVVLSSLTLTAPLVLAALGGLTSERAGVMNIGLEGKLLGAACGTAIVSIQTQNALLGLCGGICVAVVLSLLHALFTQSYGMDHIISGMAINALSLGGTSFVSKALMNKERSLEAVFLPTWVYWILSLVLTAFLWLLLARARVGLRLLAVGEDPDKARQMGVDAIKVRYMALLATGVFCGLGGALIISNSGTFSDGMTAGRGFIALAALIIGGWRPWPTLFACLTFGALEAAQLSLQGSSFVGSAIPVEAFSAVPYLATVVALAGFVGRSRPPAGLGKP